MMEIASELLPNSEISTDAACARGPVGDAGPAQLVVDVGPIRLGLAPCALLSAVAAYSIASSTRSVSVAGSGQRKPAAMTRSQVTPTVLRATFSDRAICRSLARRDDPFVKLPAVAA